MAEKQAEKEKGKRKIEMNGKFKKGLLFLIIFMACLPAFVFADIVYLPDNPGKWTWSMTNHLGNGNDYGWSKKDVDDLSKKLKAVADVIKQVDTAPKGVGRKIGGGIKFGYSYKLLEMKKKPYLPVTGYILTNVLRHFFEPGKPLESVTCPPMPIYVNWLEGVYPYICKLMQTRAISPWKNQLNYKYDDGWGIFFEPKKIGEFQGFPMYKPDTIVITRNPKPLWLPVSQERFIKALIREAEALEEDSKKNIEWRKKEDEKRCRELNDQKETERHYSQLKAINPAGAEIYKKTIEDAAERCERDMQENWRAHEERMKKHESETRERAVKENKPKILMLLGVERLRMLKEELDSLSPSERAAPAYYSEELSCDSEVKAVSCLVDTDAPGARMLVSPNPGFFDSTLPKSAIQVIILRRFVGYEQSIKEAQERSRQPDLATQKQVELIRAVDWNKIADMFMIPAGKK